MPAELKHRWSIGNNYLAGITTGDWLRLLRENRFGVDPAYWHRAAFVTLLSGINSFYRRREESQFHDQIAATRIRPPLFILGHWRSGTTHLHNLLAQDTERFAFPNTYQTVNPHTFLCTEEVNSRRFAWMVPKTRPMDEMALNFQAPQEDEFAPCLMSLRSLYLGISFPRNDEAYSRYLTFKNVPQDEIDEWKSALIWFLKKVTLKYQRPLILKSPPHTARIRLLLEMFPDARFVHIHRNPYQVFQSCRHYYDTATWYSYLQRPDPSGIDDGIIRRYRQMYDSYFQERELIPEDRFHEISFDDLEREPVNEMRKLYRKLHLGHFPEYKTKLRHYLKSISSYRKNHFDPLDEPTREKIAAAWKRGFDEWHYPT
ncbi:MAG: sulfotransferase [Luteolibacter sp.]|uniref:sulfotransferase family protein n=1 Tax=Luteolibacter sp. TaxID=1962973 RepID=UPI0032657E5D